MEKNANIKDFPVYGNNGFIGFLIWRNMLSLIECVFKRGYLTIESLIEENLAEIACRNPGMR